MNNKTPFICSLVLWLLIPLITACQSKVVLRPETTVQASNTLKQEITPSRVTPLNTPTYEIVLPRETIALPTDISQPTRLSTGITTPTRNDDGQQIPTVDQEGLHIPTSTFDRMLSSKVYLWSYKGAYSVIDLQGMRLIRTAGLNDNLFPNSPGQYPGVGHTLNLAFASYSPFVAYLRDLLNPAKTARELWLADLSLKYIEKVWVDDNNWLGNIGDAFVYHDSDIVWGPFDRYILIWSYLPERTDHIVVYDIEKKEAYEWAGNCNRLAKSLSSNHLTVWCEIEDRDSSYAVLDANGIFFTDTAPEKFFVETLAWRFSPQGDQVLFLGDDLRWRFTNQDQLIIDVPVRYIENFRYFSPKAINFQWSQDGRRLLVFGVSDSISLCPYSSLDLNSKFEKRGCWYVIDSQTGGVTWSVTENVIATSNLSIENASIDFNAALSPDGQFLLLTITDYRLGYLDYLVITSLATGESTKIRLDHGWLPSYKILWEKESSQ